MNFSCARSQFNKILSLSTANGTIKMKTLFAIFLIPLVFLSAFATFVYKEREWTFSEKREALFTAMCLARCGEKDKYCGEKCEERGTNRENIGDDESLQKYENGTTYNEPANFNATLHCKDIDVIRIKHNPGIWIIEQSTRDGNSSRRNNQAGKRIQLSAGSTISSFTNLSAGTFYRYKAERVTGEGLISEPELTPWFETFEMGHRSEEIKNIKLASQQLDELNPSRVRADIIFQPPSDRSCLYEVISFTEDQGLTIGNLDASQDFEFSLHDLEYERNVSIFVSSRNMGNPQSSKNTSLTFLTPSCLELRKSLAFCAPERVTGLRVSEMYQNGSNYELTVEWDEPANLYPDNYTLRIQSVDYTEDEESSSVFTKILPGNVTTAHFTVETNDEDYKLDNHQRIISIVAESAGGASLQTWIHITLDEALDLSTLGVTAATVVKTDLRGISFVAVPVIIVIAMLLATIVWFGRIRNRHPATRNKYDDDKRHKYCKSLNETGKRSNDGSSTFYVMEKNLKLEFEKKALLGSMIDKFEIRPAQLTIKDILGSGASGIVRLGSLCDHKNNTIDVAIKMLKDNPNTDDLKNFQQEISIMKSAGQHQNIVSIIGCCTLDVARPMLIVEYCSQGDLQTYLRTIWQDIVSRDIQRRSRCTIATRDNYTMKTIDNKVENITYWIEAQQVAIANQLYDIEEAEDMARDTEEQTTVADLLSFARQVAAGMEFLSSNRVIHRDLAARNVLLCADKTAKISDFGLSRDIYQENVYKKQGNSRLPLKWMAIEALTHQIYTTQSDVWSFGILLWEIVTLGCNPYPETPTNMILQLLKSGYRMEKPDNCGKELYDIMLSCWRSRPQRRPNFTQLKHQLDGMLRSASENEYLNVYDLLRESIVNSNRHRNSMTLIEKNDYSNIYST